MTTDLTGAQQGCLDFLHHRMHAGAGYFPAIERAFLDRVRTRQTELVGGRPIEAGDIALTITTLVRFADEVLEEAPHGQAV